MNYVMKPLLILPLLICLACAGHKWAHPDTLKQGQIIHVIANDSAFIKANQGKMLQFKRWRDSMIKAGADSSMAFGMTWLTDVVKRDTMPTNRNNWAKPLPCRDPGFHLPVFIDTVLNVPRYYPPKTKPIIKHDTINGIIISYMDISDSVWLLPAEWDIGAIQPVPPCNTDAPCYNRIESLKVQSAVSFAMVDTYAREIKRLEAENKRLRDILKQKKH